MMERRRRRGRTFEGGIGGDEEDSLVLETNGHCFICLSGLVNSNSTPVKFEEGLSLSSSVYYSLQFLSRYLRLDLQGKVFNNDNENVEGGGQGREQQRSELKITVSLCEGCRPTCEAFSELYRRLELLEMEVAECLKKIQGTLGRATNETDMDGLFRKWRWRSSSSEGGGGGTRSNGLEEAKKLRVEVIEKCSRKLSCLLPRVLLQKSTQDVLQGPPIKLELFINENDCLEEVEETAQDPLLLSSEMNQENGLEESPPSSPVTNKRYLDLEPWCGKEWGRPDPITGKWRCSLCPKQLSSSESIRIHYNSIHRQLRYECTLCAKVFTRKKCHQRHHRRVHGWEEGWGTLTQQRSQIDDDGHIEIKEEEHRQIDNEPEEVAESADEDDKAQELPSNLSDEGASSTAAEEDDDDLSEEPVTIAVAAMKEPQSIKAINQAHPPVIPKGHVKSQKKKVILGLEHLQINPVTFRVQCQLCSSEFNDKYAFQHHYRIQHLKHRFVCTLCGKVFRRKLNLTGHFDNVHKEGSFPCDKCGKLFNFKNRLVQHQRASANCRRRPPEEEEGEKPTSSYSYAYGPSEPCTICGRVFSTKGNLKAHLNKMHPDPGSTPPPRRKKHHVCDQCGKGFGTVYVLRGHQKKVHDMDMETTTVVVEGMKTPVTPVELLLEGPITALIPGEEQGSFKLTGESDTELDPEVAMEAELVQLADHQGAEGVGKYSYEEVYPFSGDPPELPLSSYDPVTRKYQCPSCPMTFLANINFQNHYKAVHLRVKFRCTLCSKQFNQVASCYRHHRQIHQGLRVKCQVCHGLFTEKTALKKHLRTTPCGKGKPPKPRKHNSFCPICGVGLCHNEQLKKHIKMIHNTGKEYLCDLCGREFRTRAAMRNHRERIHDIGKEGEEEGGMEVDPNVIKDAVARTSITT